MNPVELIVVVILLLMVLPDICAKFGRPALTPVLYLGVGVLLGPLLVPRAMVLLSNLREFGFILLLFGIGLEIDLPTRNQMGRAFGVGGLLAALQYPVCVLVARFAGLTWQESFLVGIGLSASSLGLIMPALRGLTSFPAEMAREAVRIAMAIEVCGVLVLAAGEVALEHGLGWLLVLRFAGIAAVVVLLGHGADRVLARLCLLLEEVSHWRGHILALFVLAVAALGERMGLSAPKTAFFLGLFITRATHEGVEVRQHLAPFSDRLLIPLFLVSLGSMIPSQAVISRIGWLALMSAMLLIGLRLILVRRLLAGWTDRQEALLLSPNLTIVAIVAYAFGTQLSKVALDWTLTCSFWMSLVPLVAIGNGNGSLVNHGVYNINSSMGLGGTATPPMPTDILRISKDELWQAGEISRANQV